MNIFKTKSNQWALGFGLRRSTIQGANRWMLWANEIAAPPSSPAPTGEALSEEAKDAARLAWVERMAKAGKIEIARSILGAGFEFGFWPGGACKVFTGDLRAAIDSALGVGGREGTSEYLLGYMEGRRDASQGQGEGQS